MDIAARDVLSMSSERCLCISGMDLGGVAVIAAVHPILPFRWPRPAKSDKGRVLELCAVALLGLEGRVSRGVPEFAGHHAQA